MVEETGKQSISVDVASLSWSETTKAAELDNNDLFPIRYYLFNSSKKCVAIDSVMTATQSTAVTFEGLNAGTYTVYAVCRYPNVLTKVGNTITTTSLLIGGSAVGDVCMGSKSIAVNESVDTTTIISASHVYSSLSLTLTGVSTNVASISALVTPVYEGIAWNGKGANATKGIFTTRTVALQKSTSDAATWECVGELLPPSSGNVSLTIAMTHSNGVVDTLKSSTSGISLKAGVALHLTADYQEVGSANVSNVTVPNWESETLQIAFSKNETTGSGNTSVSGNTAGSGNTSGSIDSSDSTGEANQETSSSGNDSNTDSSVDGTYKLGDVYKDSKAIIVSVDDDSLLLLGAFKETSEDDDETVSDTYGSYVSLKSAKWRFPTVTEWKRVVSVLGDSREAFNKNITAVISYASLFSSEYVKLDAGNDDYAYYHFKTSATENDTFESCLSYSSKNKEVVYFPVATVKK